MQIHNKQLPWQIAQIRKAWVTWVTLPLIFSEAYFTTWYEVFREPRQ